MKDKHKKRLENFIPDNIKNAMLYWDEKLNWKYKISRN